jgi:hypothetical protein
LRLHLGKSKSFLISSPCYPESIDLVHEGGEEVKLSKKPCLTLVNNKQSLLFLEDQLLTLETLGGCRPSPSQVINALKNVVLPFFLLKCGNNLILSKYFNYPSQGLLK